MRTRFSISGFTDTIDFKLLYISYCDEQFTTLMTTSGPHDVSGPETIRYNTAAIHANY